MSGKSGFVYVFLRADGLRKLGWTTSVQRRRLEHIKMTALHHEFEMAWEMGSLSAYRVEQAAHNLLSGRSCSWSREVYDLPLSAIMDAVQRGMRIVSAELADGLRSYLPTIDRPDWENIIPEAEKYLEANPDIYAQIIAGFDAAAARIDEELAFEAGCPDGPVGQC